MKAIEYTPNAFATLDKGLADSAMTMLARQMAEHSEGCMIAPTAEAGADHQAPGLDRPGLSRALETAFLDEAAHRPAGQCRRGRGTRGC